MARMEGQRRGRRNGSLGDLWTFRDGSETSILVPVSERLRRALHDADLDIDDVARAVGVNHRTVQRWIAGRVPYPRYRRAIAKLVKSDETELWPGVASPGAGTSTSEIVNVYSTRADVPPELWRQMLKRGRREVDLLGSALLYLFEGDPAFMDVLWRTRCDVRIALADPKSTMVAQRDAELGLGGTLAAKIQASMRTLKHRRVKELEGVSFEIRLHSAPMYCSLFRADDEMLVTPHLYGRPGRVDTPVLHLRRHEQNGIFTSYLYHFDDVFGRAAVPA
jgi:transcriptional regulator with XRE-family HTH domain